MTKLKQAEERDISSPAAPYSSQRVKTVGRKGTKEETER